jgi:tRNA 2-thiouridine synthesizing protein A
VVRRHRVGYDYRVRCLRLAAKVNAMRNVLDVKGLACPLPVLKAKKRLKDLEPGDELEVLATDPSAVEDFKAFAELTGHKLLDWSETDGVFTFRLKRKA